MSAEPTPSRFRAYRHLLASGDGGFQTVAAAAGLAPELLDRLEREVGFFALPGGGPASPPAFQLRLWDEHFHLLTRYQLLGPGADGRAGDYLAESLLAPTDWLAGGDWDVDAAFETVEWWGPQALGSLPADPLALNEERLPALVPGPLDRLSGLVERAPDDLLDHLLLAAVAWLTRRERLIVVEADAESPEDLATVVRRLPLALPPSCRATRRRGPRAALELRTRGPARGMSAVDVAGVAAADLDAVEPNGPTVIDLGRRLPLDDRRDLDGFDYVQWAKEALRNGRWEEVAEVYRRAEEVPGEELFRRFAELRVRWREGGGSATRGASAAAGERSPRRPTAAVSDARREVGARPARRPAPAEDLPGDAPPPGEPAPGVLAARRDDWRGRRTLEAAAARGHDALRGELADLTAAVEAANARLLDRLRDEVARAGDALAERLAGEHEALWARTRQQLEALAVDSQRQVHEDLGAALRQIRKESEAVLRGMEREREERELRLEATADGGGAGTGTRLRWGWRRLRNGLRRRPAVAWLAAILLPALLGWGAWSLWNRSGERAADADATAEDGSAPGRQALLAPLREGETVRALLLRARGDEALAGPAAATALALVLGEAETIDEEASCLLLQAALGRRGLPTPQAPLAIDGDCGSGTWGTLSDALAGSCCADIPLPAEGLAVPRRSCFFADLFELPEEERCGGADPLAADRAWTAGEAARVLELVRHAAREARPAARPRAEALAARLDLAASPAVAERAAEPPVDAAEAGLLLALARRLAAGGESGPADDAAVARLLDELSGTAAPGNAASPAAGGPAAPSPAAGGAGAAGRDDP